MILCTWQLQSQQRDCTADAANTSAYLGPQADAPLAIPIPHIANTDTLNTSQNQPLPSHFSPRLAPPSPQLNLPYMSKHDIIFHVQL